MSKKLSKYFCAVIFCIPSFALAGGTESVGGGPMGGKGAVAVKDSADKTKKDNDSAKTVNYVAGGIETAIGGGMIVVGYNTKPAPDMGMIMMGVMMVGMGMSSFAQGAAHGDTANQAGLTGFNTDGYGNVYGGSNSDPSLPNTPYSPLSGDPEFDERNKNSLINRDPTLKQVKRDLQKLEKMGILDSKKGTIKAGGKTYKISDFSSPAAMAAAGLPKGAIDGAMAMSKDIDKKTADKIEKLKLGSLTPTNGFAEGGGGGKSASAGDSSTAYAGAGLGAGKADLSRDPSNFAGMQKNYNGEPIGVAADSIFLMMNRRYKVKESQESFFSEAELALKK